MKITTFILIPVMLLCLMAGCQPEIPQRYNLGRQDKYQQIAIVCTPNSDADPNYARLILKQVQDNVESYLGFLEKVDSLFDVKIDTVSTPPRAELDNISDYDAVLCLVYSCKSNETCLEFYLLDTDTNKCIWYHQFVSENVDPEAELLEYGRWVTAAVKSAFYDM